MRRLIAVGWRRFWSDRVNRMVLALLVLAVAWHFWSDYRTARTLHLLDDGGRALVRLQSLSSAEFENLSEYDKWRTARAQEVRLALPDAFGVSYWIWSWMRAAWGLLAAAYIGNEYRWGTLRWHLSLGAGRASWIISRAVVLILSALVVTALIWTAVCIVGLCVHRYTFGTLSWNWATPEFWIEQAASGLRAWIAAWPLIGLGVLLAVISRSAVPAVALGAFGLVLDWLWAQAMVLLVMRDASALSVPRWLPPDGLVGDLYRWSISYNGAGVAFSNALAGAVKPVAGIDASAGALAMRLLPTTPERALWIVLGYVLLTGAAAAWLVVRRDVTR